MLKWKSVAPGTIGKWIGMTLREGAWAPLLVFLSHVIADRVFHAYGRFPSLDIPMHFLGGVAIAVFFYRACWNASHLGLLGPYHPLTHRLLVFTLVGTTTGFWEFTENISDHLFGTHGQVDLDDTMKDMALGMAGGLTFLIGHSFRR